MRSDFFRFQDFVMKIAINKRTCYCADGEKFLGEAAENVIVEVIIDNLSHYESCKNQG